MSPGTTDGLRVMHARRRSLARGTCRGILIVGSMLVLVTGCGAAHGSSSHHAGGSTQANHLARQAANASNSPMPRSSIVKKQRADANAQKRAAKVVAGAPGSGATQPNTHRGQVMRDGRAPHPSQKAAAEPFSRSVRYPDGVQVDVVAMNHATSSQQGRGARPNEAVTIFQLRMTNSSNTTLNLNEVVVTATIDHNNVRAQPIYLQNTDDFGGALRKGDSATTSYAFTIPPANLGHVALSVDFDGQHTPAAFHGSAR